MSCTVEFADLNRAYKTGARPSGCAFQWRPGPCCSQSPCCQLDDELAVFSDARMTDLADVIVEACASRLQRPDGRWVRHPHQQRRSEETLDAGARALLSRQEAIGEADGFHALLLLVSEAFESVRWLGPLTSYDVAHRIGRWLGHEPEHVYIHAGAEEGAKALGIATRGRRWISRDDLPAPLVEGLTAAQIEDLLCIYKGCLGCQAARA